MPYNRPSPRLPLLPQQQRENKLTSLSRYLQTVGDGSVTVSVDTLHIVSITVVPDRAVENAQNTPRLILRALVKLEMNSD